MSNLSDIGFDIETEQEFHKLVEKAYEKGKPKKAEKGTYFQYSDSSGAELWIQFDKRNEIIGANPHFKGKSRRKVCLTTEIERCESILDGAFHAWADPLEDNNPESGAYPFVFDVPDIKSLGKVIFPQDIEIQLSAFAQEFDYYKSEEEFSKKQEGEPKWASQSFVPSGLFNPNENESNPNPPEALGLFAGIIKEYSKKKNQLTEQEFYWLLIETLGGEIDVVADLRFFEDNPNIGGVVHGQFWLSGQLMTEPKTEEKKKNILNRLFGKK